MHRFEFHRPTSLSDAVKALRGAEDGKFLAGGQSLLPMMKLGLAEPSDIVHLGSIEELRTIAREGEALVIGAAATHAEVAASSEVRGAIPALAELAEGIGDPQVRNRGTLGGSVAHGDPAADYPAALVALGATVRTDRREISADDFFTGMFETALEEDELIKAVSFPIPERAAYAKFPHPASRYAVVGVMVAQSGSSVRVAVTGAGPKVFRVGPMEKALADAFEPSAIASISVGADDLVSDTVASAAYRAHLVNVMARRAVTAAAG